MSTGNVDLRPPLRTTPSAVIETDTIREGRTPYGTKMINGYEMITQLGRGQHGEVWYSKNSLTQEEVVRTVFALWRAPALPLTVCPLHRPSKR